MKIHPRCAPCLLSRVQYEAELSTDDVELQRKAVLAGIDVLRKYLSDGTPAAEVSTRLHRAAYRVLGDSDPYVRKKRLSNQIALKMLPAVRDFVKSGDDHFRRAIIASIVGNTFDFGVLGFEADREIDENIFLHHFKKGLDADDTDMMKELLDDVVYISDNCGEIVFDQLLFEEIKRLGGKITLVVRGAPILNDATMHDVRELGFDKKVDRVLTTGSNAIGVCIRETPPELINALNKASLIISKGMANYETMSEHDYRPIAYLLRIKCESVAGSIGFPKGSMIARLVEKPH